ncbi:MAG: hypothetical protein E6Q58_00055 [Niabella sp.]|nr:MAG: hypothetical protein E6Q58_00055 [Niabella sp.]
MNYSFVVTSNVDGHFQTIFNEKQVYEVHGSIHYLQCSSCCELTENKFIPDIDYK